MPQMSPLMWGILFITFSTLLLISLTKMYYMSTRTVNSSPTQTLHQGTSNSLTWVW